MNAETLFFGEISKLKRRAISKAIQRTLLYAALTLLGICTIVLIIEKTGLLKSGVLGSWYILLIGFSLLVGLLTAILNKKDFQAFLIDIDTRLMLKDRLSTAYEYQKFGKKSVLLEILMEDATNTLRQLSSRKLFPPKFSFLYLSLVLLILINMALYSSDYLLSGNISTGSKQYKLEKIGTLLRNYTENRIKDQKGEKTRQPDVYRRELENLSRKLEDRSITRDQLFTSLNRFLKDVQGKQTRLTRALDTQLKAARIEEIPLSKIPTLQNLSATKLEKLKRLLNQLPNNQIPYSINRDVETLRELYRLEKLLSQVIDDIKEDTEASGVLDRNQRGGSQSMNASPKASDDSQRSKTPAPFSSAQPDAEDSHRQPGSDQSQGEGRDLQKGFESRDGYSSAAGRGKSSGKKKSSTEIEKSPGPGIQDKMISSQMQNYVIHIRSLTAIGESRVEPEDIIRNYQQEIEGILQKEDIPLNYREYIKHYFISIGLKTEENAHEYK